MRVQLMSVLSAHKETEASPRPSEWRVLYQRTTATHVFGHF